MPETMFTIPRGLAARRYRDAYERSLRQGHGERRVMANQAHQAARSALTPQQAAITDMVVLRGQELDVVARKADRTSEALEALLAEALDALQVHYRAVDAADEVAA